MNNLKEQINKSTPWNCIQINEFFNFADLCLTDQGKQLNIQDNDIDYSIEYGVEADDIMAVCPKFFPNSEVILVTIDKDVSQCLFYDNCKIFNPNLVSATNKAEKGYYVIESDPLSIIQKKVRSGDKSDNIIVNKKKDTEKDIEIRELIINMLNMPKWLEDPVIDGLNNLKWNKKLYRDILPFQNSLAKKFATIYNSNQIRTFEESVKRHNLKEKMRKEKQRLRYKNKREKAKL
jgi:hypothetical protein